MNLEFKFEEMYKANYSKVKRLTMGYTNGDDALSDDLTQEVFIKVWENINTFRKQSSISTWIYRITVNTCLLSLRKKKKLKISGEIKNIYDESNMSVNESEKKLRQLYHCIDKLNKDNKSIILLELEGLPQKEIAQVLGITHEAVRVRVHRIKNKLTKCVKHDKF